MRFSYKWLSEFVEINFSPEELVDKLTNAGLEVVAFEKRLQDLSNLVVGKVIESNKHPEADKLSVCKVDVGTELLQIVCGAPNVKAGQTVPVALIGAELPGNFKIKKAKLRGIESYGMICSAKELELSEEHQGILVLPDDLEVGKPLNEVEYFDDYVYELEITANRPDALSIIGIAREISALFNTPLKKREFNLENELEISDEFDIEIEDLQGCPRYCGKLIKDVQITESPYWLRNKIEIAGMRSINNVVDITNLVMIEYGQPLHAFDYQKLPNKKVIIKKAEKGQKFTTLDDVERQLDENILMITDNGEPIAIAGVMGGAETEIDSSTKDIFLESAYFDPKAIFRARRILGLHTEASNRFSRGANPEITAYAADYAAYLFKNLANAKYIYRTVDVYPNKLEKKQIIFSYDSLKQKVNLDIEKSVVDSIFTSIGIEIKSRNNSELECIVPLYRHDLSREIDLIEEIARIYGYDKIPVSNQITLNFKVKDNLFEENLYKLVDNYFLGNGFNRILTNPLIDTEFSGYFSSKDKFVKILNPLSKELDGLRQSLIPGLIKTLRLNVNRYHEIVKLFEVGKIFISNGFSVLPDERYRLSIGIANWKNQNFWRTTDQELDFYYLKGIVENYLYLVGLSEELLEFRKSNLDFLDKDFQAELVYGDRIIGFIGLLNKDLSEKFEVKKDFVVSELDFDFLLEFYKERQFILKEIVPFPFIDRDISFIARSDFSFRKCYNLIKGIGKNLIQNVYLKDLYKGKNMASDEVAITIKIIYRDKKKTLTDESVNRVNEKIRMQMSKTFDLVLR